MKRLLYDINLKIGDTGFTISKDRYAYDLFKFGEKIELYDFDEKYKEKTIGEAEILFMFIEVYKKIDKKLLKDIRYPAEYKPNDLVTIIFYKRIKKGESCLRKSKKFFKDIFK